MKTYRTRYSLLIVGILAVCFIAVMIPVVESFASGKASKVYTSIGTMIFYLVICLGAMRTNYIIDTDNKQLIISTFFSLFKQRIDVMQMTRITPTRSLLSAPASSLRRIRIEYKGGRFKNEAVISPYMQDDFLTELKKINPGIDIEA